MPLHIAIEQPLNYVSKTNNNKHYWQQFVVYMYKNKWNHIKKTAQL